MYQVGFATVSIAIGVDNITSVGFTFFSENLKYVRNVYKYINEKYDIYFSEI